MLTVACVKWGKLYGPEYVNILYDSVRRNLAYGCAGRFICFTDDPSGLDAGIETRSLPEGLEGWWNKLYLFSPEVFPKGERVLYFDLDTVIAGPIDGIAAYKGPFAILRDVYRPDGLQSSVMAWEAGNWTQLLWRRWPDYKHLPWPGGDQQYIETQIFGGRLPFERWQELFPGRLKSYKADCREGVPKGCSVVFFHGLPRPHEVKEGWVPHVWKVGGGSGAEFIVQSNTSDEELRKNVLYAKAHCSEWLKRRESHLGTALIVAGGPSLEEQLFRVKGRQKAGDKIFACGNVGRYLLKKEIWPDAQVLLDARPENAEFVLDIGIPVYIASQCSPKTWQRASSHAVGFHAAQTSYADLTRDEEINVGGGTTVGLKAIALAFALGYRRFHLFGFDSCYREGQHHAYPQALNDGERRIEVSLGEAKFYCAPWMVTQAEEFKELAPALVHLGCTLCVHGEGLIPTIAQRLEVPPTMADVRAQEILKRLNGTKEPKGAEVGVFAGELSVRLLTHPRLTLYLVDSWTGDHSEGYKASGDFHAELSQAQQDHLYESTRHLVSFAEERAQVMRADSLAAAREIPNESLDFVFLDADHTYEAVKADLAAWWPKVRPGGFLSGHDYENPEFPLWGVKQAVTEEFGTPELGDNFTWFVYKPETLQ